MQFFSALALWLSAALILGLVIAPRLRRGGKELSGECDNRWGEVFTGDVGGTGPRPQPGSRDGLIQGMIASPRLLELRAGQRAPR